MTNVLSYSIIFLVMKMKLRNKRLTLDDQIRVLTDYNAGMLIRDIEKRYGITRGSIYFLVHKEISKN